MSPQKLFAVLLGGRSQGCHIELHDIVFIVGESLEAVYPRLVKKWFGNTHKRLHVDSSLELDIVDGHEIALAKTPPEKKQPQLYCVNFGGYQSGFFGEIHEVQFYVGHAKKDIIKKAKADLCVNMLQQHCDDNLMVGGTDSGKDVDDVLTIGCVDGYYIHLTETNKQSSQTVDSSYRRLDVPKIMELVD